jgi:hypothetical protein
VVVAGVEEIRARAIGERTFVATDGPHLNERFDFPRAGFARFGSRLARRAS